LKLAAESRRELTLLLAETGLSFDYRLAGKLHLYPDQRSFAAAQSAVLRKTALGFEQRMLSRAEAQEIEPALARYQGEIAGAVYTPGDALGDAAGFCRQLTHYIAQHHRVSLLFGRKVAGFARKADRLTAVRFDDREELEIDAAVVAAGPQVRLLAAELPEVRPVRPVRGYSLTMQRTAAAPTVSLTDVKRKLAFASIGDRFRVAGLADIERPGAGFDPARFEALRSAAADVMPDLFHGGVVLMRWSGERPMTPSSRPIIGASEVLKGVYINTGHGMLGWTLALGSARRMVDLIGSR
jgi:D-amino-acid dehydrogenase